MSTTQARSEFDFVKALRAVAANAGQPQLEEFIVECFCEAVRPFGWERGIEALKRHMVESRFFPTLHELVAIVNPSAVAQISDVDDGAVAASRIWEAIGRFGDRKTGPAEDVFQKQREFIGDLGWAVVGSQWSRLCAETKNDDMTTLKAQWRMEIKGVSARLKAGMPLAPGLPSPDDRAALPPAVAGLIAGATAKLADPAKSKPILPTPKDLEKKHGW